MYIYIYTYLFPQQCVLIIIILHIIIHYPPTPPHCLGSLAGITYIYIFMGFIYQQTFNWGPHIANPRRS